MIVMITRDKDLDSNVGKGGYHVNSKTHMRKAVAAKNYSARSFF